jgi:phenylalanyl-tRNA synthetase beta subunit
MTLGSHELTGVSETERRAMVERLAHLILQAAGGEIKEVSNDEC